MTTLDYDGESPVPQPVSETVNKYLRKSISLSDVLGRLLRGWHFALVGALLGSVLGVCAVWITPPSYSITLTLLPLEGGTADLGGGGATGLGALGGLLGISGPSPKFTRFVVSLYSVGVAHAMDKKYNMLCRTFNTCASKDKPPQKSPGFYPWINRTIASIAHMPDPEQHQTVVDLSRYTARNVIITSDVNSRMLTLNMSSREPEFAKIFLVNLVNSTNDFIKDQDNAIAKKNVEYVTAQLKTNTDLSQRAALTSLLAQETTRLMFTAVDIPYVAQFRMARLSTFRTAR